MTNIRLPWFRAHVVIINDPGRLIATHLVHTGLVAGWAGLMILYELIIVDPTDPVYSPIWRQSCYVLPQVSKLGLVTSNSGWSISFNALSTQWTFELVFVTHILLSGLLILAAFWHWSYWDLELFFNALTLRRSINLNRVFGIHLALASLLCFGFGSVHLAGSLGPGLWISDEAAVAGTVKQIVPSYQITNLTPFSYGVIASHHEAAGLVGLGVGCWHIYSKPGPLLFKLARLNSIESVLSSSIAAILWVALITSSAAWYGTVSQPVELNGPTRYHWDNAFFNQEIENQVEVSLNNLGYTLSVAYDEVPDNLFVYDYLGSNPAKGGLFRSGPITKGDGIIENWIGHPNFVVGSIPLQVRRSPSFFETFPVLLVDRAGQLRADIAFRRSSSRYSIEQTNVSCFIEGGVFSGSEFYSASLVKNYARKAQFGSIFTFDRRTLKSDGVFRTSIRGWYSFSHSSLAILFLLGHLWHASRTFFKQIWTGVSFDVETVEYGYNEKLGDDATSAGSFQYL